jgi:hypothetical protein
MINWRHAGISLIVCSALAGQFFAPMPAVAAEDRYVSVGATCVRDISSESLFPTVEVTIENESGLTLSISYLHSFGSPPDSARTLTGLKMEDPGDLPVETIPDGETVTHEATWGGGDLTRSDTVSVLAVTSAGVFLSSCNDEEPHTYVYEGDTPIVEGEEAEESATIAALAIGQLESWRAYPALYSLIHPEARERISFEQITCWYVERYGPPVTDDVQTIFSTEVSKVVWADWTWNVSGTLFEESAEITYSQSSGFSPEESESVEAVMHLVREDGLWRWFFGSSAEGVAAMSSSCDLPATT